LRNGPGRACCRQGNHSYAVTDRTNIRYVSTQAAMFTTGPAKAVPERCHAVIHCETATFWRGRRLRATTPPVYDLANQQATSPAQAHLAIIFAGCGSCRANFAVFNRKIRTLASFASLFPAALVASNKVCIVAGYGVKGCKNETAPGKQPAACLKSCRRRKDVDHFLCSSACA
jgi:hypothetical protein